MNKVEIDLGNIDGKEKLLKLFGEIFELGGPNGNVDCSSAEKKGWGINWDALNDSLSYLDAGGIWGNSKRFTFPLHVYITHYKKFEQEHPRDSKILIEILVNKVEQYKRHEMEFEFKLVE